MSDIIARSALLGCFLAAFFGSMAVRRAPYLDGKLAEFRRVLLTQLVGLVVFVVGLNLNRSAGLDGSKLIKPGGAIEAADLWLLKSQAADSMRQHTLHMSALVVVLVANLPMVLHLLRELQSFVLHHRTDLLARDQAAGVATKG